MNCPDNKTFCPDCPLLKECLPRLEKDISESKIDNPAKYAHYLPVEKTKQDVVL